MVLNEKTSKALAEISVTFSQREANYKLGNYKKISFTNFYVLMLLLALVSLMNMSYYDFNKHVYSLFAFNMHAKTIYFTILVLTTCLALLVLKPKIVNRSLYYAIPALIVFFILTFIFKDKYLFISLLSLCVISMCTGLMIASTILSYIYTLSSTERLVSVIFLMIFVLIYFIFERAVSLIHVHIGAFYLPLLILIALYLTIFFVDPFDFSKYDVEDGGNIKIPSIFLLFFITIFIINFAVLTAIKTNVSNDYKNFNNMYLYMGLFLSGVAVTLLQYLTKNAIMISWLIWSVLIVISYQVGITFMLFPEKMFYLKFLEGLVGFADGLGLFTAILMLGKFFEDNTHSKTLKLVTVLISSVLIIARGIIIMVENTSLQVVFSIMQFASVLMAALIIITVFLTYLANKTRPVEVVEPVKDERAETLYVNPYNVLTEKEIPVFEQLMLGLTLRQIAGELKMKYDTVNYHYKNIYTKLDVNSKIELILRYSNIRPSR